MLRTWPDQFQQPALLIIQWSINSFVELGLQAPTINGNSSQLSIWGQTYSTYKKCINQQIAAYRFALVDPFSVLNFTMRDGMGRHCPGSYDSTGRQSDHNILLLTGDLPILWLLYCSHGWHTYATHMSGAIILKRQPFIFLTVGLQVVQPKRKRTFKCNAELQWPMSCNV